MPDFKVLVFYATSAVLIYAALRVITARNPVVAVLHLVLAFFNAAGLWMLLHAEFLAITLVLVYVGAVMVLFLFVVMMLDINIDKMREGFWTHLPMGLFVGGLMLAEMVVVLSGRWFGLDVMPEVAANAEAGYSNTKELGRLIYTQYVYPFELAAVILLVAIIAAIALTMRKRKDSKYMDPHRQINIKRADRVRMVNIASVPRDKAAAANEGAPQ
jgi:NADH-quinone oxidoreductase subunit J